MFIDAFAAVFLGLLCGSDCGARTAMKTTESIRCKECGHRVMYKPRTHRSQSLNCSDSCAIYANHAVVCGVTARDYGLTDEVTRFNSKPDSTSRQHLTDFPPLCLFVPPRRVSQTQHDHVKFRRPLHDHDYTCAHSNPLSTWLRDHSASSARITESRSRPQTLV